MRADAWVLCVAVLSTGCASVSLAPSRSGVLHQDMPRGASGPSRVQSSQEERSQTAGDALQRRLVRRRVPQGGVTEAASGGVAPPAGGIARGTSQTDAWEQLLTDAGIEDRDERPLPGGSLSPAKAERLMGTLLRKPVTLGNFPARMAMGLMLREVLETGEASRDELVRRAERFAHVAVLRPDGYLAWVRSGRTQQRVGPVEWKDGVFRAHSFELGRFYVSDGFLLHLANERMEPVRNGPVRTEVHDDADYVSRTLDGAEAAFVKLALSIGHFFTYPWDSIASLKNLPVGVAALIESSPEYFERFRHMTRGEQVQAVAELTTDLLVTTGTATATTRTMTGALAGAEATVPLLSLSAQGALAIERVTVPVGRAAAVLGGGPGAAIILHRTNTSSTGPGPAKEPGQWAPTKESMSARARRYQEQISGHTADDAYWVGGTSPQAGGVRFDGFKDGVLLEAKGPGYANKFLDNLKPKIWFEKSGAKALLDQAARQLTAARGASIRWHIAEEKTAAAIRRLFDANDIEGIEVVFTPPLE